MILVDASLRISVVAAIVALILTVMRVRAGGVRHGTWTIVLVTMLLMPILQSVVPSFPVPVPASAAIVPAFVLPDMPTNPPPTLARQHQAGSSTISFTLQSAAPARSAIAAKTSWPIWPLMSTAYVIVTILLRGTKDAVRKSGAILYAIGMGTRKGAPVNVPLLEDLTTESGGHVEPLRDPSEISAAVTRICDDLQSQYLLAFEPAHADGKYHAIAVKTRDNNLRVRTRAGYFAFLLPLPVK